MVITKYFSLLLDLTNEPITTRYLRYRVVEPQPNRAMAVCEFVVNKPLPARLSSTIPGLKLAAYNDENNIAMVRVMETAKAAPGQGFSISFATPVTGVGLTVDLDNRELLTWGSVEFTLADGSTEPAKLQPYYNEFVVVKQDMPRKPITGIRFTNTSDTEQELRLNIFQLAIPGVDTAAMTSSLTDCDFATAYDTDSYALNTVVDVPAGARIITIVGTARCEVDGATYVNSNGPIHTYRLNKNTPAVRIRANRQYGTRVYEAIFR